MRHHSYICKLEEGHTVSVASAFFLLRFAFDFISGDSQ